MTAGILTAVYQDEKTMLPKLNKSTLKKIDNNLNFTNIFT